jgi:hypothetical protein
MSALFDYKDARVRQFHSYACCTVWVQQRHSKRELHCVALLD